MKAPNERPRRSATRKLRDEEIALWIEVAKSVARRRGASLPEAPTPPPAKETTTPAAKVSARDVAPPPAVRKPSGQLPLAPIERSLRRDLARGHAEADAVLDLHGYNQAEAHHALRGFLRSAQSKGARLVIVVTGKGGRGGHSATSWIDEPGVLRRLVPHWLRESDLRSIVLGFEEAARPHGGAGALYVRLRRRHPKGGI